MRGVLFVCAVAVMAGACDARSLTSDGSPPMIPLLQVTGAGPGPTQGSPLTCFLSANRQVGITEGVAIELCRNARSEAPAQCFAQAQDQTPLFDGQIIELCRCAESTQPVDCFLYADRSTFLSSAQIVSLCNARASLGLYDTCLESYGPQGGQRTPYQ